MTKFFTSIALEFQPRFFLAVFSLFLSVTGLNAQANNPLIAFQGILKNSSGGPVDDGTYQIKFRLYNVSNGGNPLWEETASVKTTGGIYSHNLGKNSQLLPSAFANTVWLGIEVNGNELSPRTQLMYAPYTFSAAYAQEVACSGKVGDVKYSLLNPQQFAALEGACWVPMDGRSLSSSDKLRQLSGLTKVPDASGMFLRGQEFPGAGDNDPDRSSFSNIGEPQDDGFEQHGHSISEEGEHTHTVSEAGEHTHTIDRRDNGAEDVYDKNNVHASESSAVTSDRDKIGSFTAPAAGKHTHTLNSTGRHSHTIGQTGTTNETRPKNVNLWVYIRIN
jgi:hypothetical protein